MCTRRCSILTGKGKPLDSRRAQVQFSGPWRASTGSVSPITSASTRPTSRLPRRIRWRRLRSSRATPGGRRRAIRSTLAGVTSPCPRRRGAAAAAAAAGCCAAWSAPRWVWPSRWPLRRGCCTSCSTPNCRATPSTSSAWRPSASTPTSRRGRPSTWRWRRRIPTRGSVSTTGKARGSACSTPGTYW